MSDMPSHPVANDGAPLDPSASRLESILLRTYMETHLYHLFLEIETGAFVKRIREHHFDQEIAHLHTATDLLKRHKSPAEPAISNASIPI